MKTFKFLSLSALAVLSGVLAMNYIPGMDVVHAENEPTYYDVGYARTYTDANMSAGNLYFSLKTNNAPYKSDSSIRYKPVTEDAVKFKRDGVTYNVGNPICETIVKYSRTKCSVETWMFAGKLGWSSFTLQHGDEITLDGSFSYTDGEGNVSIMTISKTTFICSVGRDVDGTPEKTYFAALPQYITDTASYQINMTKKSWHFLFDINGLEEDDAPWSGDNASQAYYPTSSDCFYLDGKAVARVEKEGLRRRNHNETDDRFEWYPTVNDDIQGLDSQIKVGSIFVIDGIFVYRGNIEAYTNYERLGLRFHMLAFERIGEAANDYRIIDLHEYLYNAIHNEYSVDDFVDADKDAALSAIDAFDDNLSSMDTSRTTYTLYNETLDVLSSLTVDPNAIERMKQNAITTINGYVDLDDYFEEEQGQVTALINQYTSLINAANKRNEINNLVEQFKEAVANIHSKADIMSDAILNQETGYEQYLMPSDDVTLYDLGYSEAITFHGKLADRANDLNTNSQENNIHNTFAASANNENGNVQFHFSYTPNTQSLKNCNLSFVLRGLPYYGYKFNIDSVNRDCFFERLDSSSNSLIGGYYGPLFVNGTTYDITLGAIDLVNDVDKTWIFIKVNGELAFSHVINSLLICNHPRIGIAPDGNMELDNDYEGTSTIDNPNVKYNQPNGLYAGRLIYSQGNNEEIKATLDPNSLPFNKDGLEVMYPVRKENVQLIRNDITTDIAKVNTPIFKKLSETDYVVDVDSVLEVQDNDTICLSGAFYSYSDSEHEKITFNIAPSRFTYHADSDSWTPILTLAEAKEDAIKKLDNYLDISKYDSEDQVNITNIIDEGKAAINAASTIEEVDSIYASYKGQLDAVKTSFRKYQDTAINVINAYKADELDNYRQDEKDEIASLKQEAITDVEAATNKDMVDEIVINLKADIDDLMTDAEYKAMELADAIKDGQQAIYDYYSSLDTSKYTASQLSQLEQDTKAAISAVKAASSIEEVNSIVQNYINSHPQINNKGGSGGCHASVNGSSSIIFIVAIGGLIIALRQLYKIKRKEK